MPSRQAPEHRIDRARIVEDGKPGSPIAEADFRLRTIVRTLSSQDGSGLRFNPKYFGSLEGRDTAFKGRRLLPATK
jgi:hypothetical protein